MATIDDYLNLIPSENANQPAFRATLTALLERALSAHDALSQLTAAFDLDTAVGAQLDIVGLWIGVSRNLTVPIASPYFSFDIPTLGFDEGIWYSPFNPLSQIIQLPDSVYRVLLRTKVLCNQWDGSAEQMRAIWAQVFTGIAVTECYLQDNQNMTMDAVVVGPIPPVLKQLILNGGIPFKPAGVKITYSVT